MKKILVLFLTFLKIGAFTFGGGYAMLALLENEFVSKKKWIEKDEFLDMIAIAESTPGPVAVNSATYIGYTTAGFFGALFSTLGVVLPSFLIIYVISLFFDRFLALEYVGYAFRGIQVCVVYLILSAGIKFFKALEKNLWNILICVLVLGAMVAFSIFAVNFSAIFYILLCGGAGLFAHLLKRLCKKEGAEKP